MNEPKQEYEMENKILEEIYPLFKSATVWKEDGTQEQIVNILRKTVQATLRECDKLMVDAHFAGYDKGYKEGSDKATYF